LNLLRQKVESHIALGVQEKFGTNLQLTVTTHGDEDYGSSSKDDSFWLKVHVTGYDIRVIIEKTKGAEFAEAFYDLFTALSVMQHAGEVSMNIVMANVMATTDTHIMQGLGDKIQEKVASSLGGTVEAVSVESFEALQAMAASGRCCQVPSQAYEKRPGTSAPVQASPEQAMAYAHMTHARGDVVPAGEIWEFLNPAGSPPGDRLHDVFWVDMKLARGGGALGFGYGREGHCPRIAPQDKGACVAKGTGHEGAVQTKHVSYTHCFDLGEANSVASYGAVHLALTAPRVQSLC